MKLAALAAAALLTLTACQTLRPEPTPDSGSLAGKPMIDAAMAMLGQPYRYGGAAPGGFDCSGLVAYAAAGAGLHVPRTAREQEHVGVKVSRSDLKAGDLIFMHLHHKELHVAIALDHERFIHAPATGGQVRIDTLDARVYANGFIEARRIIGVR